MCNLCPRRTAGSRGVASAGIQPGGARRGGTLVASPEPATVPVQSPSPRRPSELDGIRRALWWCTLSERGAADAIAVSPLPIFGARLRSNADAVAAYPIPAAQRHSRGSPQCASAQTIHAPVIIVHLELPFKAASGGGADQRKGGVTNRHRAVSRVVSRAVDRAVSRTESACVGFVWPPPSPRRERITVRLPSAARITDAASFSRPISGASLCKREKNDVA